MELETHIEMRVMSRHVLLISGLSAIIQNLLGTDAGIRNLLMLRRRIGSKLDNNICYCNAGSGSNEIIEPIVDDRASRSYNRGSPPSVGCPDVNRTDPIHPTRLESPEINSTCRDMTLISI